MQEIFMHLRMVPGTAKATNKVDHDLVGSSIIIGIGSKRANRGPTFGMKFNKNANKPITNARSTLSTKRTALVTIPTAAEIKTFE